MRPLFALVAAVVLVEAMLFGAVAPLLPQYSAELGLSKLGAGILTASYAAGATAGAVPGGSLATRFGVKPTLSLGLTLLGAGSVVFAFAHDIILLDAARFLQGVGGIWMWVAGMAWLVSASSPERRGELIGAALGAAIVGLLLGPVIGGAATASSPRLVFSLVAPVALLLGIWAWTMPDVPAKNGRALRGLGTALRSPSVLAGSWLLALPALFSGLLEVLAPLQLDRLGASGVAIGAIFLCAAALEAVLSPLAGRLSDRRGRLAPMRLGLLGGAMTAVLVALPNTAPLLGVAVLLAFASLAGLWAPAMAMVSDASETAGLDQGLAFSIINLAWAGGQFMGSAAGGALAHASSDFVPYAAMGALCAATLTGMVALERRQRVRPPLTR